MKIAGFSKYIKTGYQNIIKKRNASKALKEAAKMEEAPPKRKIVTGADIERILRQESYRKQQAEERASRIREIKSTIVEWHATTYLGLLATAAEAAAIFIAGCFIAKPFVGKSETKINEDLKSKLEIIEKAQNRYKQLDLVEEQGKTIGWSEEATKIRDSIRGIQDSLRINNINAKQVKGTIKTVSKTIK